MMSKQAHTLNGIGHFDVSGPNIEQLGLFYSSVFGWQMEAKGPGYALLNTPEGSPDGALVDSEQPSLTVSVVVSSLDKALASASAAGGTVLMALTDNGWVKKAQICDPAGNRITLIQG